MAVLAAALQSSSEATPEEIENVKLHAGEIRTVEPRMIAERKPVRPVQIAAVRQPIKVVKPFTAQEGPFPATALPLRPAR